MTLANMGLNKILSISVPVLNAIYPIAIMLILLGISNRLFSGNTAVYRLTLLFTGVISIVDALWQVGLNLGHVTELCKKLPLYSQGLGWIIPAMIGIVLGVILKIAKENSKKVLLEME